MLSRAAKKQVKAERVPVQVRRGESYTFIHTVTNKEYLEKMLKKAVKVLGESERSKPGVKRQLHEIEQEMMSGERISQFLRFQPIRKAKRQKE
jgi:hypothetical protein